MTSITSIFINYILYATETTVLNTYFYKFPERSVEELNLLIVLLGNFQFYVLTQFCVTCTYDIF